MRPIYRAKDQWVLGYCVDCGSQNYVEPHGTTAECQRCSVPPMGLPAMGLVKRTEHRGLPSCHRVSTPRGPALIPVPRAGKNGARVCTCLHTMNSHGWKPGMAQREPFCAVAGCYCKRFNNRRQE